MLGNGLTEPFRMTWKAKEPDLGNCAKMHEFGWNPLNLRILKSRNMIHSQYLLDFDGQIVKKIIEGSNPKIFFVENCLDFLQRWVKYQINIYGTSYA